MKRKQRVLYVQYTTPAGYTILGHGARMLAKRGWEVLFLGVDTIGSATKIKLQACEGVREKTLPYCPPGFKQKLHYIRYCFWVCWHALNWRADAIYCSDRMVAPIGWFLSKIGRFRVVFHEHDPPRDSNGLFLRSIMRFRKCLATNAIVCIVPNQERVDKFVADVNPKNAMMVWNAVSVDEIRDECQHKLDGTLRLWYQGALGPGQLPLSIVDAIAMTDGVEFAFAGYETFGTGSFVQQLLSRAESLGVSDRVRYVGTPATRDDLYAASKGADVGLVLFEIPFRDVMAGASQKPFEYMAAGMAMLVPDLPEWERFTVSEGFGRSCLPNQPESIARELAFFRDNRVKTREMGTAAQTRIRTNWNYESQFKPVVELLEATATNSGKGSK